MLSSPATQGYGLSCASPTQSNRGCSAPRTVTETLTRGHQWPGPSHSAGGPGHQDLAYVKLSVAQRLMLTGLNPVQCPEVNKI